MAAGTGVFVTKEITPVLNTGVAYADGDVLWVPIEVANVFSSATPNERKSVILNSIMIVDEDDEAAYSFDIYFFRSSVAFGTINDTISITDANAAEIVGFVAFTSGDSKDLLTSIVYNKHLLGMHMQSAEDATSLWMAGVSRGGTPTYAAATDLKIKLMLMQD